MFFFVIRMKHEPWIQKFKLVKNHQLFYFLVFYPIYNVLVQKKNVIKKEENAATTKQYASPRPTT